ncbi:MAG: Pleiotropic regulatory protein [Candidatus Gottesmanbacteria bacterium GW2011_GWC2_42_8]|nr:MAG: Pleiotropic regulatory protein [Candidatus Gottesmanbacteria bacterium GW2011_GWC2_42_8]
MRSCPKAILFWGHTGVKFAVGVASGTDALMLSMQALGINNPGEEVIMPANSYPTAFAVVSTGARPRLVDIDGSFNIDPLKIEKAITAKTRAIIAVHLFGQPADLQKIMQTANKYNLPLIEDCAQAHGAVYKNPTLPSGLRGASKKVGSIGKIGCYSFYPTKNLGAFGDGGMIVTNDEELFKKIKLLRMYGEEERYKSVLQGRISRLDEIQAAILSVKLQYLDKWNERRREIAGKYRSHLENSPCRLPPALPFTKHVYHLFVIRTKKRDLLKNYLEKKGIATGIHYPVPIHLVPSFKSLGYKEGDFPESEKAAKEILSLPMFPELKDSEIVKVAQEINSFLEKK